MTASEIFAGLAPEHSAALLGGLREKNRPVFQSVTALAASRRKLRPAFVDKKPVPERLAWLATEMARKTNADMATEVVQAWLFACCQPMLVGFLDALGVSHDGEGLIEDLPEEPSAEKLEAAVAGLLQSYPAWQVAVYLNLFCEMDIARWPKLADLAANDPRLSLRSPSETSPVEA